MSLDILRFRAALVRNGSVPSGTFGSRNRDFVTLPRRDETPSKPAKAD